jgi:ketosteroid isomerase-like protein
MNLQKEQSQQVNRTPLGSNESQIKSLLDELHAAIIDRNVDEIMTFYSPDIIAFDVMGPLEYVGWANYKKTWEESFKEMGAATADSGYDTHQLKITASDEIAFCYGLNHCYGTMKDGKKMDMWMRSTQCLKKISGKWLITHEQFSVPVDFESGKALMDLRPDI